MERVMDPKLFRSFSTKIAKIVTPLQPHQQRVVDRIQQEDQPGLIVAHGLGSGKTLTAIAAHDALNMPADVVVPAALKDNYAKEIAKHTKGKKPSSNIQSLQNLAVKKLVPQNQMLIVDEAHRLRGPQSTAGYQALKKNKAEKRLLLTGSPFYNRPSDIAPLVAIAAGSQVLPTDQAEFEKKYIQQQQVKPGFFKSLMGVRPGVRPVLNPQTKEEMRGILQKWVDYHEGTKTDYPDVTREDVKVPMDSKQLDVYDTMMGKAPLWVRMKVKAGLPPSKQESKELNAFLGAVRQISNTTQGFSQNNAPVAPKIQRAYEELKKELDSNPRSKAVVYSNFLESGINPYKQKLDEAKIPYGEFTGEMSKKKRDQLVRDYNDNKLRTLLLSSAGGEGLDLKGTRLLQVLEPHWNDEKLKQVEGRGIRYKSHADLPKEEQNVRIQRFLATRSPKGILEKIRLSKPGYAVDEYLTQLSGDKDRLNDQFRELLKAKKEEGQK
jgi:SNF2 family DNA or RNA helicase